MHWLYLVLAVLFEAAWALLLKASDGFSRPLPGVAAVLLSLFSLGFLGLATRRLDLSVAYAIWTGLGGALVACASVLLFQEPMTPAKGASIALIVLGVAGLRLSGAAS